MRRSYLLFSFLTFLFVACSDQNSVSSLNETEGNEPQEMSSKEIADTFYILPHLSEVRWVGSKTIKSHNGTVPFKDGFLLINNDRLVGGVLNLDMTKIEVLDLAGEDKERLTKKLEGEEFFKVAQYPSATIKIIDATSTNVDVDLTILGKAKRVSSKYKWMFEDDGIKADFTANLKIDRTNWGIVYGSGTFMDLALDKAISDEIEIEVKLKVAKR